MLKGYGHRNWTHVVVLLKAIAINTLREQPALYREGFLQDFEHGCKHIGIGSYSKGTFTLKIVGLH